MLPDPRPYFADLSDPRRETRNKLHKLSDIIMIVFCAVLSGIEDWVGMEEFAEQKEPWLRRFLELPNGIPSHDTLSDVVGRLKPGAFAEAFLRWVQGPAESGRRAVPGWKPPWRRGRASRSSAECRGQGEVIGATDGGDKTNEITAIQVIVAADLGCLGLD
jgi:hypothetical protein